MSGGATEQRRVTTEAVLERVRADEAARVDRTEPSPAVRRLTTALEGIGWRAASEIPAEEVAPRLWILLSAFSSGHRDLTTLRRHIAGHLRTESHALDGSSASISAWEPAAAQLLELYLHGPGVRGG